jgi:Protein of unknown function (DUF3830)
MSATPDHATVQVQMNDFVRIDVDPFRFVARFESSAPKTSAAFRALLPYRQRIIHVRWSGEACWIPLGDHDFGIGYENATSYPAPGEILVHPIGISETEILLGYGAVRFASKVGQLAGNHFLTVIEGREHLRSMGERVLWQGAHDISFMAG